MPYKVIAHRRPEALGGRQHPFQTAPALVANDQGQLSVVHDGQRQFMPMSPEGQREALGQVLGEKHNWYRYPHGSQPDWLPGSVVKSDASGGSYIEPNEPVLTPDAKDDGGAGGIDDGGEDDGAVGDTNVLPGMAGPPNTAPRQLGKMQVMCGKAKNDGEPFDYRLPLTTCVTCVNLQPVLLQIQPCRMPSANINLADFGYYNMVGGCPYYQFGMSIPPGGDDSDAPAASPATSADVSDTIQPGTFQMSAAQMDNVQMSAVQMGGTANSPVLFSPDAFEEPRNVGAGSASPRSNSLALTDIPAPHLHSDAIAERLKNNPDFQKFAKTVTSGTYRYPGSYKPSPAMPHKLDNDGTVMHHNVTDATPGQYATEALARNWSGYGGSGTPHAIALQRAVHAEFGTGAAALAHVDPVDAKKADILEAEHPHLHSALRAWARAQYDHTQTLYAGTGKKSINLSRGLRIGRGELANGHQSEFMPPDMQEALRANVPFEDRNAPVRLQPMSSFTAIPTTAKRFSEANFQQHPVQMGMSVPTASILGSHETGLGSRGQKEHVMLGGDYHAHVQAGPMASDRRLLGTITYPPAAPPQAGHATKPARIQMDEVDEQLAAGADADTSDMVRGALIQLLGGEVTGTVSRKVELVGPPETTDAAGANDADAAGANDTDGAGAEDDDADAEKDDAASNADVDDSFHPDAFPAAQTGNDAGGDVASGRGRVQMGSFDGDLGAINRVADRLRGEPHFERMARSMAGLDGKSDDDPASIRAISSDAPENRVRDAVEHISHTWDDEGGTVGNPLAYAMAKAVHAVHGHGRPTLGHVPAYLKTDSDTRYGPHHLGLQAWAKAQYAETQDHLRKTGQSHVTGYRRMIIGAPHVLSPYETDGRSQLPGAMRTALDSGKEYRNADQKINMAPLSSFSSDPHLWEGANDYTQRGDHHVAMAMHIPAKDVFATHETGLGTHRESEVVALGGTRRAYVHSTPAPQKPDFSGFGALNDDDKAP